MSGGPFAGQVHGPPRFSGLNCRVQLFNYRVWGPAAAIPGPLHARSKCEYIHTRAHVDAFRSSPPTKRETRSFLPTRNQIRDTSGRFTLRSIRTFHPFWGFTSYATKMYSPSCTHRFRSGTGFGISIDQPPSYFTPTYHFTCPTRRPSSYHEAASRHISPLLAPRPTFSQTSPLLRCQESAPFWYIVLNPNESVKMALRYFPSTTLLISDESIFRSR